MTAQTVQLQQGSESWHQHRANHFNASDASAMMGVSSYKSRSELIKEKATGIIPEVDEMTQKRFDKGHHYEAMARPWAEEIIGEELYPVVKTAEIEGLSLSASLDGLTMLEDITFEHKTLNGKLVEYLERGEIPQEYWPQMEQGLLLTGASKCLFMASSGNKEEMRYAWYESSPAQRASLINNWKLFAEDVKSYTPEETQAEVVGHSPDQLPALRIEVTGMVTASNIDAFKSHAITVFDGIKTDLLTDQDFADAETTVKFCKDVESKLDAAKDHALSQTADIDALFKAIDEIKETARQKRLQLSKLVKDKKENIKADLVMTARKAMLDYLDTNINVSLGLLTPENIKGDFVHVMPDFAGAIKGLKSIDSMRDKINVALNDGKIEASNMQAVIAKNIEMIDDWSLVPDFWSIHSKANEDFKTLLIARKAQREEQERAKLEAERERIRQEEEARAKREAEEQARQQLQQEETKLEEVKPPASQPQEISPERIIHITKADLMVAVDTYLVDENLAPRTEATVKKHLQKFVENYI